jgi:hypothetical protein
MASSYDVMASSYDVTCNRYVLEKWLAYRVEMASSYDVTCNRYVLEKWLDLNWFEESHVGTFLLGKPQ